MQQPVADVASLASRLLRCGRFSLSLSRPLIMGVVNVTPDSFSDGGQFLSTGHAVAHAYRLADEGADLVDVGAESTRPGAEPVPYDQERSRLLPVLRGLQDLPIPVSVDTRKPAMMQAALEYGVSMINDIDALRAPGALDVVAASDCAVCLMHKQGEPPTMQDAPRYHDVVQEVFDFLATRVEACDSSGIARNRLLVDPGLGFGKTVEHNLALLRALPRLARSDVPVLVGLSRKALLGKITGQPVAQRQAASVAAAMLAVQQGASVVRVHDVAATRAGLSVLSAFTSSAESDDGG